MNSKANWVILFFILFAFFLRGILMTIVIPPFFGPDEEVHFSTIQYRSEPKQKSWELINKDIKYRYPDELNRTLEATEFFKIKPLSENIIEFSDGEYNGRNERLLKTAQFERYNRFMNPYISTYPQLYYLLNTTVERFMDSFDIITRLAAMRIISVLLGCLVLLVIYFSAQHLGLSKNQSLLFTSLVSFQPMFSFMSSVVNPDILLIFSFTLFLYSCLSILRFGFRKKNVTLLLLSIPIGIFTKGPAMLLPLLVLGLIIFELIRKRVLRLRILIIGSTITLSLISALLFLTPAWRIYIQPNLFNTTSVFPSLKVSVMTYLEKTMDYDHIIRQMALSYWGNFGWLDAPIHIAVVWLILLLEILAGIGILLYLFRKATDPTEKRMIIFLLIVVTALQFLIRFYDWHFFDVLGRLEINTQGRYFLPNLFAHLYLILFGLNNLLRKHFRFVPHVLLVGMISLYTYSIFFVIIPRYYF